MDPFPHQRARARAYTYPVEKVVCSMGKAFLSLARAMAQGTYMFCHFPFVAIINAIVIVVYKYQISSPSVCSAYDYSSQNI